MTKPYKVAARFPGLDTLRTLAIVSVVIFHLQSALPAALGGFRRFGWLGVDLFFVLSGFLIGSQLLKQCADGYPLDILGFYRRRAYRILPAYFTVVALYIFLPPWREKPGLAPGWEFLTFTYNLLLHFPDELAFSHAWSLCIEEHFYLLLPLILLCLMRRPSARSTTITFVTVLLFGLCMRWWELSHVVRAPAWEDQAGALFMKRIYYPTYSRLDGLLFGVALATLRSFRPHWWTRIGRHGLVTFLAGTVSVAAAMWTFHFEYPSPDQTIGVLIGFPIVSLGFALWVASAVSSNGPLRLRIPGFKTIATLAFSLYLTHKAVAHVAARVIPWLEDNNTWSAAALYAVICLTFAALLYSCVEMPFLRLRDRGLGRSSLAMLSAEARTDPGI